MSNYVIGKPKLSAGWGQMGEGTNKKNGKENNCHNFKSLLWYSMKKTPEQFHHWNRLTEVRIVAVYGLSIVTEIEIQVLLGVKV